MSSLPNTRRATLADLDAILTHVQAGFDSYVEFAPSGWQPPSVAADRDRTSELLADPGTWALLALEPGCSAGHVAFFAARERTASDPPGSWRLRPEVPGLAHLWQLFVMPGWWGQGLAAGLHDAAVAEMRARGFLRARLFTPSLHARARGFYERRGWTALDARMQDELGLMCTEYRLALDRPPAA